MLLRNVTTGQRSGISGRDGYVLQDVRRYFLPVRIRRRYREILSYLKEPVDVLPWEVAKAEYDKLGFGPGESEKHTLRI